MAQTKAQRSAAAKKAAATRKRNAAKRSEKSAKGAARGAAKDISKAAKSVEGAAKKAVKAVSKRVEAEKTARGGRSKPKRRASAKKKRCERSRFDSGRRLQATSMPAAFSALSRRTCSQTWVIRPSRIRKTCTKGDDSTSAPLPAPHPWERTTATA